MSQLMTGRHLGGLTAAVLAGALLAVAPLGSQALAGGTGAGTGGGARPRRRWRRSPQRPEDSSLQTSFVIDDTALNLS